MQVTARRLKLPLNQMFIETHVTTYATPEDTKHAMVGGDGCLVHGLFLEGARWVAEEGVESVLVDGVPTAGALGDSKLQELLSPMPVMYIKAVRVQVIVVHHNIP